LESHASGFGINVVGRLTAASGVGLSARYVARALVDAGITVRLVDLGGGTSAAASGNAVPGQQAQGALTRTPVDLLVLDAISLSDLLLEPVGPPGVAEQIPGWRHWLGKSELRVGLIWWELAHVSRRIACALELFDVLLAGSDYLGAVYAKTVSGVHVIPFRQPLQFPAAIPTDRSRFGLPEGVFLLAMSFDPNSDVERKNPFGAIEAFRAAFVSNPEVRLVIKLNAVKVDFPAVLAALARLREIVAADPRILLVERSLPYEELLSLYASCDAFVSLHRAEGLGLVPMEAMYLGKPVIATAWSGNMSYMSPRNACLARYKLIPVVGGIPEFTRAYLQMDTVWADPDLGEAAAWMRHLASDPALCREIGGRAAADIREYMRRADDVPWAEQLRALWEQRRFMPESSRKGEAEIRALRTAVATHREAMMPLPQRLACKVRRETERRLLWRLRTPAAPGGLKA
jgi:glycosyltransferase involved in cell wall biosynthesis